MKRMIPVLALCSLVSVGVYFAGRRSGPVVAPPVVSAPVPAPVVSLPRVLRPEVQKRQDQDWEGFRRSFPYHIQALAVSERYADGSRSLVVSEPPPGTSLVGMQAVDPSLLTTNNVRTHTIGHDGWVKDVVFNLPDGVDDAALENVVKRLSAYLFGTEYGAYCLRLPVDVMHLQTKFPLDLRVNLNELDRWASQGTFVSQDGKTAGGIRDLVQGSGGVYFCKDAALVAWSIPDGAPLGSRRDEIRRFALDSDLIVGAVKVPGSGLVVLARERLVPVDILPPLRAETIALLAHADSDELGQSYERNTPLAGKFSGTWDWAPSYLSPALLDTEYGSLLNIADQLLKSWTQHGQVRYQNFGYSDPARFPFDDNLLSVLGAESLLFNWNTAGVGYVATTGGLSVYGLNRTGSLPVMYDTSDGKKPGGLLGWLSNSSNGQQVRRAEEDAYDYFASVNDPVLARVVQYASLYQAFRNLRDPASTSGPKFAPNVDAGSKVVRDQVRDVLGKIANATPKTSAQVAATYLKSAIGIANGADWLRGPALEPEDIRGVLTSFLTSSVELQDKVKKFQSVWGDHGLDCVADLLAVTRSTDVRAMVAGWQGSMAEYSAVVELVGFVKENPFQLCLWVDIDTVRRAYSAAVNSGPESGWMHTQSVVVSSVSTSRFEAVFSSGGHNLGAGVTGVAIDPAVPAGQVKLLAGKKGFAINPADAPRASSLVRLAAREENNAQLSRLMAKQLGSKAATVETSPRVALALGDRPERVARGFTADLVPPAEPPQIGKTRVSGGDLPPPPGTTPPAEPPRIGGGLNSGGVGGRPPLPPDGGGLPPGIILLEKREQKVFLYRQTDGGHAVAEAWNSHDAVYAVLAELNAGGRSADKRPLRFMFGEGYTAADAEAFTKSLLVQAERYPGARPVLIFRKMANFDPVRMEARVHAAAAKTFEVSAVAGGLRRTRGTVRVTDGAGKQFAMEIDASFRGTASEVSGETVNSTVRTTAKRAALQRSSVTDLGAEIYQDLNRLTPGRRAAGGTITVEDAGDFHIVIREESGPPASDPQERGRSEDGLSEAGESQERGSNAQRSRQSS